LLLASARARYEFQLLVYIEAKTLQYGTELRADMRGIWTCMRERKGSMRPQWTALEYFFNLVVGDFWLPTIKRAWAATKLVAIATLVGILAAAPVDACDVRPDKSLTGGAASIRTKDRIAACGHAKENRRYMTASGRTRF
jgi:hypothetical protein